MNMLARPETDSAPYPLTPMQVGMLLNTLYSRHSGVDVEQVIIAFNGALDRHALEEAWSSAVHRHDILRTRFMWEGIDQPQQAVDPEVAVSISERVSRSATPPAIEAEFRNFVHEDRYEGFDYHVAPLMRLTVYRAAQTPDRLVWTFPHALLDGRGITVLLEEIFSDYDHALAKTPGRSTTTSLFRPFVQWYTSQNHSAAQGFWRQYLDGLASPTPLIEERVATTTVAKEGIDDIEHLIEGITIPPAVAQRLREVAVESDCTLHTFIQGAWALLLSRYSGQSDIVFGSTRACRHADVPGIDRLPGLVINTLPFRVRIDASLLTVEYLKSVRNTQVALRAYEHTPLERIQAWSSIPRGTRLFESIVVFDNSTIEGALKSRGGGWAQRGVEVVAKTAFPLTLQVYALPTLHLRFRYARDRFSAATVRRMLAHLSLVLEQFSRCLNNPLSDIEYLSAQERHEAMAVWGQGPLQPISRDICLHHLVERQVLARPDAIAVILDDQRISYAELDRRAGLIADRLSRIPIQVGQPVAVILERSVDLPIALYGILKAGGCYVPIDPTHPSDRIHYIIGHSRAAAVITTSALSENRALHPACPIVPLDDGWHTLNDPTLPPVQRVTTSPTELAYIIFTSGSTGEPKGVMIEHLGAVNTILDINRRFAVGPTDRALALSAYNFDLSVYDLFGMWAAGGAVVLIHQEETRNPTRWDELVTTQQVSIWNSVPALVEMAVEQAAMNSRQFPSVRVVMMSGDWIPVSLPDRIPNVMPHACRYSLGGATEASIWSIIHPIASLDPLWKSIPYGRPMDNQAIYVLDARLSPCGPLVPGDIFIGGIGLARGYCGDAVKTNAAFIHHPVSGERIYRTGDVGRWHPDGLVEFQGRIDHQVKIRGFRIELGEIETVASTQSDLRECIVAVREDVPGQKQLVLYYVPAGPTFDGASLRATLERKLPEYMVPTYYVELESLPLSANGKVDRRQLPAPQRVTRSNAREPSAFEQQLMAIWKDLLHVPSVALDDSFFELGGNSLLALRLIDRMERTLAVRTDLATIFSSPTIARLCERLGQTTTTSTSILIPIQVQGSRRPLFFISGYLDIGRHVGNDQPFYGLDCPAEAKMEKPDIPFPQLAQQCIEAMQRVQPKGPYLIGGHCFGAVVAFTMATMLQERGAGVRLLVMMDPPAPDSLGGHLQRSTHRWRYHLRNLFGRNPVAQMRYMWERANNFSNRIINRLRGHNPAVVYDNFTPALYQGQISMVFAKESYLRLKPTEDPRLAWTNWASSGLEIIETPGDHVTFCREPNVRVLGAALRERLDQAQKPYSPPVIDRRVASAPISPGQLACPSQLASEGASAT